MICKMIFIGKNFCIESFPNGINTIYAFLVQKCCADVYAITKFDK